MSINPNRWLTNGSVPKTIQPALSADATAQLQINTPNRLSPILQAGSGIRYDIRKPAQEGIASSTWQQISRVPALEMPTFKVLIISKAFPWSIVIRAPAGSVVTCGTIFEELHKQLQRHIEDAEWAIVAVDKTRKGAIEKAAKSRQEKDKINRLKRIDWLETRVSRRHG